MIVVFGIMNIVLEVVRNNLFYGPSTGPPAPPIRRASGEAGSG